MSDFLMIAYLETKKMAKKKIIWGGVLAATLFAVAIGIQGYLSPESFGLRHVKAFFATIGSFIIYYFSAKCLGEEFDLKTSTMIFTSRVSRVKLYFAKLVSMFFISILMAAIITFITTELSHLYGETLNFTNFMSLLFSMLSVYLLYVFVVGSFALFITTLTGNSMLTVFTVIITFSFSPSLLGMLVAKYESLRAIMGYIPFYTADSFINYHSGGIPAVIGILVGGVVFLAGSIIMINNKDLK